MKGLVALMMCAVSLGAAAQSGDCSSYMTLSSTPFNQDYFKTLWARYKAQSEIIQPEQTLYSFRHTGAIDVFKRTGSLTVLHQAMGHASLAVSLGYLRNLEVPILTADSMPSF